MRSRLLIGASAYLLGALAATGGSMLAVGHLANGLLGPGTQQLSSAVVSNDLASDAHDSASAHAPASTGPPAAKAVTHVRDRSGHSAQTTPSPSASAPDGTLLVSAAGTVTATCQSGQAYLLTWSPAQGYQTDRVFRGPAATASVNFEGIGVVSYLIRVSCNGGVPVERVSKYIDH